MAKLFAKDSGYGIDNSPTGLTNQFVQSGPNGSGTFDGNHFYFATSFNGGAAKGWYQGSGFQTHFENGDHIPDAGTVNSINIDFDGGNTQDVSIDQISVPLVDLFNGDSQFFRNSVFNGDDSMNGSAHDDNLFGYSGNDTIIGGWGDKLVPIPKDHPDPNNYNPAPGFTVDPANFTSDGSDTLRGGGGNDMLDGGTDGDKLFGGSGRDVLYGGGDVAADTLNGGGGADTLYGGAGNDSLIGGAGNDRMLGEAGADILNGGAGNDRMIAAGGNDTLNGGGGGDKIFGGGGNDTFVFANGFGNDTISDFSASNAEKIDLSAVGAITSFADLVANHLVDSGGDAMIVAGANSILLDGITVAEIGNGLAFSGSDFIF